MASEFELTNPVTAEQLRAAFPRSLRAVEDAELTVWLGIEEHALRSQFGVTDTSDDADVALRHAMIIAWPSFHAQVRQVSQETSSTDQHSVTYARAGVLDFTFPSFVSSILREFADAESAATGPSTTDLVR